MHKAPGSTAREDARQRGRLLAAEVAGAIEGLLESLEKYELERNVEDATQEARRVAESTADELRRQARAPEGQMLGQELREGAEAVGDMAQTAVDETKQTLETGWEQTTETVEHGWDALKHGVDEATERVEHAAEAVVDETKARSQNLARAGRRAKRAPGAIMQDVKQAAGARVKGMASGLGLFTLAGMVALTGFIVLTVAAVAGMNAVVGAPEGAFIVALIYLAGAAAIGYGGYKARQKAKQEADAHMRDARYELANVARPLRRVFSAHRVTPPREDIEPREPEFEYTHWNRR